MENQSEWKKDKQLVQRKRKRERGTRRDGKKDHQIYKQVKRKGEDERWEKRIRATEEEIKIKGKENR